MKVQVIWIRLKAFDSGLLDSSIAVIVSRVRSAGISIRGPIPLPRKRQRATVNRSPHVDKKSREHFEILVYKRLLILVGSNSETADVLAKLEIPAGVDIEVEVMESN
ncbi:30S ribosomal protein S10 [Rickettsiales bacterium]|nr:30S ribosomal protein S10 [Rickettsiales bacterium]